MKQMPPSTAGPVVTGAQYVEQLTALESDRLARQAFHDLVLRIAPPGATLFDFGAGTGMDARFYAERGFTVGAYDIDVSMREFFATHCGDLIDAGRVRPEGGGYRDFLGGTIASGAAGIDLVTSNFAPFNLVADLHELFAKFHALTGPGGRILASVLSPYFIGDLKYGWWWRNAPRLWRDGHFAVQGAQAPIVRRRLADFARQSAPYFTLKRVFRGLPAASARDVAGFEVNGGTVCPGLRVTTCRFMFLLFEKCDGPPHASP